MSTKINDIILIDQDYEDADPSGKIEAITTFVDGLHDGLYEYSELPQEAVHIYWIDSYMGEIANGGPAQFVFNSRWDPEIVEAVGNGLAAIGAERHAAIFEGLRKRVDELGAERLEKLLKSTFFGENPERDFLNRDQDAFFDALEQEDAIALMSAYIDGLENIVLLSAEEWASRFEELLDSVPDKEAREERMAEDVHWHDDVAEKLCDLVGERFDGITGMELVDTDAGPRPFVYFRTERGMRAMLLMNGIATMVDDDAGGKPMAEYPCPEALEPGDEDHSNIEPRLLTSPKRGLFGGLRRLFGG